MGEDGEMGGLGFFLVGGRGVIGLPGISAGRRSSVPGRVFDGTRVSKSDVADVRTPLELPLIWGWGISMPGSIRPNLNGRVGGLKMSGP